MRNLSIILLMFLFSTSIFSQTNLSGTISSDSTLTSSGNPYIVTANLTVQNGVTLTVESGVVMKFNSGVRLYIYGTLNAQSATFTSAAATPAPGDWGNIQIGNYYNTGSAIFDNCQIMYAGRNDYANIFVYDGTLNFVNSLVSYSNYHGIRSYSRNNTITINNSTISNCNYGGISAENNSTININNSVIQSCDWPIRYEATASIIFNGINNFTGNTHDGILLAGSNFNSIVLDTVGIPYVLNRDIVINTGETLTIAPGNVIKSTYGSLIIKGKLIAVGSPTEKIYFTSYKNDNLLGDTNDDGSTTPSSGDWNGVYFDDPSDDTSIMEYCEVSFAGRSSKGAITTYNASPTIRNCTLSNNYYGAKFIGLSNPTFSNNSIGSSDMVPVAMSFEANPVFTNNSFSNSDNQYDAIGILDGTLLGDATLIQRDFTSVSNVTYLLLGNVTVPAGMTLTINEGIVIKAYNNYHRIRIEGKLISDGTEVNPIVFTSVKDDTHGNPSDTNKDGTNSVPNIGDWSGIVFKNGSDPSSIIDHNIIKYAHLSWYEERINEFYINAGALTLINSSPTISNTIITDVSYGIMAFGASNPAIENCTFENAVYTPIALSVNAAPTFSGNTFTNSGLTALGILGEHLPASATIPQRTVAGYTNITYVLLDDLTINSGTEVTVSPGVVIKPYNNKNIWIEGGFKLDASTGDQIIFTSIKDDNSGNPGDTNGDGDASSPASRDWGTINYLSTSDDAFSVIENCLIKFSGYNYKGAITFTDAAAPMNNVTISDSYFGVRCEGSSNPTINDLRINNCLADPIAMSLKSDPTFTNIQFTANGSSGIRLLEGTLASDATLSKRSIAGFSNIAYIVENLTISPNATLTIDPGVVIKFVTLYYNTIRVEGALIANGTDTERIVFTSLKDDSNGGDTNNDGNNSTPAKGDWRAIRFEASPSEATNSLTYCDIRYGGNTWYQNYYDGGTISIFNSEVNVDQCIIEQSSSTGIGVYGSSNPTISNTQINNINKTPVILSMFSTPTFTNNQSLNVGIMALGVKPENYSVDGTMPIRSFGGYSNITYYLYGISTVNSGTEITIPAGLTFKDGRIDVKGKLTIDGSLSDPVVFTDLRDDMYGNPMDTNGDGTSSSPDMYGTRIKFYDVSNDGSIINYGIFRYSDIAIHLDQASPIINNTTFSLNEWGFYLTGVSKPEVTNCSFEDLKYTPLRTSLVSYPASTSGNTISGSTYRAIGVLDGETLVQEITLPKRNFAGITNIPYLFGNYEIASNAVLTIEPGVVLKFFDNKRLTVRKGLQALGGSSADSNIVFTHFRDDFYGGDTNADSTDSSPGSWYGIYFEDESNDPLCNLDHVIIQYTGNYYWSDRGAIVTTNASPTITNSILRNNYHGVVAKGASNPVINFCDIYQNEGLGVNNIDQSFVINAENNWWGNNSGPTHSTNPGGAGQAVSDAVDFDPWLGNGASHPIMGDVSLNGSVQAFDASKILKYVVDPTGPDSLNIIQRSVADVSDNGGITAYDASLILQYTVGLISSFPAEAGSAVPVPIELDNKTKQYLALQKVNDARLIFSGATVNRGEEFDIPVEIHNSTGITALQIEIQIDKELFSFGEITLSERLNGYNLNYAFNENTKKLIIAIAGTAPIDLDGDLLNIKFTANKEIKGTHNLTLRVNKFLANETDYSKSVSSASIEFIGKPTEYGLNQNYPNPFNPSTIISYRIPDDNVSVKLIIYDLRGRVVKVLVNDIQNAGKYNVSWNSTNEYGLKVSSGIYFYRIITDKYTATKKLMILK